MPPPLTPELAPLAQAVAPAPPAPALPAGAEVTIESDGAELVGRMPAMACTVTARVRRGGDGAADALARSLEVIADVARSCTRFDPTSPLMLANADPGSWTAVPPCCLEALLEAYRAYIASGGRFDPRVLEDLVALGYDRSMDFGAGEPAAAPAASVARGRNEPWRPAFRRSTGEVRLGDRPVDLGGIGKGLAVRWAAEALRAASPDHLVDAGGDCWCGGSAPDGGPWRVGIEEPAGGTTPVAVLELSDRACATSSTRVRRWHAGRDTVHHLIDPGTGRPGGEGLAAVTVVASDPADAEVWAKVLFLSGRDGIAGQARRRGLAALWVGTDHHVDTTPGMDRYVLWRAR